MIDSWVKILGCQIYGSDGFGDFLTLPNILSHFLSILSVCGSYLILFFLFFLNFFDYNFFVIEVKIMLKIMLSKSIFADCLFFFGFREGGSSNFDDWTTPMILKGFENKTDHLGFNVFLLRASKNRENNHASPHT